MFTSCSRLRVQHVNFPDCFFLRQLLCHRTQGFSTVARPSVGGNCFIKREYSFGFSCSLLRVSQPVFVITRLNEVVGELFDGTSNLVAISLKSLSHKPVEAATPDRIEFFIQDFANLVMRKTE